MNSEQQQAARARCEAATPGPWESSEIGFDIQTTPNERGISTTIVQGEVSREDFCGLCECEPLFTIRTQGDRDFIAHARADIPAALDALEAAEAEIARLRAVVRELREHVIAGDLAAMEMTSGFLWTKQREAEYRANADQITRKLTGETDNPITKETNHVL